MNITAKGVQTQVVKEERRKWQALSHETLVVESLALLCVKVVLDESNNRSDLGVTQWAVGVNLNKMDSW